MQHCWAACSSFLMLLEKSAEKLSTVGDGGWYEEVPSSLNKLNEICAHSQYIDWALFLVYLLIKILFQSTEMHVYSCWVWNFASQMQDCLGNCPGLWFVKNLLHSTEIQINITKSNIIDLFCDSLQISWTTCIQANNFWLRSALELIFSRAKDFSNPSCWNLLNTA